jgi:Anti-anti-sigma regulatory factor (antagonist of anti-sigma factor)
VSDDIGLGRETPPNIRAPYTEVPGAANLIAGLTIWFVASRVLLSSMVRGEREGIVCFNVTALPIPGVYEEVTTNAAGNSSLLLESGATVRVLREAGRYTVEVAGRVTVESSPGLRSTLLKLLRSSAAQAVVVDLSEVSYLDTSGIATLLEALKAALEHSVTLRLAGVGGQPRILAEIMELGAIFHAAGAEVEFR